MVMLKIYLNWLFCALCLQKQVYRLLTFEAMHRTIEIKHCSVMIMTCGCSVVAYSHRMP